MIFLSPWILLALAVLPALWWLMRALPPQPREVEFPAFFLLKDLQSPVKTSARAPWWLLLLRCLIIACFIFAMAAPVKNLNKSLSGSGGSVMVVIDNGWAAAAGWEKRQDKALDLIRQVGRSQRSVILLTTADVQVTAPLPADEAEKRIATLQPQPWPTDIEKSREVAETALERHPVSHSVFLSDGLAQNGMNDFLRGFQEKGGGLTVVRDENVNDPYIVRRDAENSQTFAFHAERLESGSGKTLSLAAHDADGGVIDRHDFDFPVGQNGTDAVWDMLPELRGQTSRVGLSLPAMASATFYTDQRWRQRPAGIIADSGYKNSRSFLNEVYYIKRALEGGGSVAVDTPERLMKKKLSAMIWPDSAAITAADRVALLEWVKAGGLLVRFAGSNLAEKTDDALLPIALRHGQRAMQGAMTWEKPLKLTASMPDQSPLLGIDIPEDVVVSRQVLADPTPESFEKTWLQLEDGTPLITGGAVDKGMIVLIHTTAGPDWANFCYSGLYVEALQRMVALSTGIGDYKAQTLLPPLLMMDGFGRLHPPGDKSVVTAVDPAGDFTPSARTPPGLYGDARQFKVYNLGDVLPPMKRLGALPNNTATQTYAVSGEKSLKADFFLWGLIILLIETLATFRLRGYGDLKTDPANIIQKFRS